MPRPAGRRPRDGGGYPCFLVPRAGGAATGWGEGMSDKPESLIVRMLRWIDSGVSRLMERVGQTERQTAATQLALGRVMEALGRIEARLERIERRLPPE